ncbi:holin-associated N-acetylmuramidase [Octadecabacter sp. CECT 8868]|uniref:holin-associated N-acetylmuramidase n=1 Tax=Octadecabacter algicola TaxID=2909342 RepID=UPI001F1F9C48|nr:holin-associated N-acetylmuramidase [Octadecabacter algicola]MCF2903778.1 holin-associated N-acetylmuramidase [Octadecabacter algicola]
MHDVQQIARDIVAREGGYVNDPDDPGGATNHGVTIHTMRRLGLDLDRDGVVTENDVRVLRQDQAVSIFVDHYFKRPRIAELPAPLHATVFDMYVNAGANAVRILQRLLQDMRIQVSADSVIGPQTIAATQQGMAAAPDHFVDAYGIARRNYYYALADARPTSRKYARRRDGGKGGWITRAEEFISPRYHLSDAQHRERTALWV